MVEATNYCKPIPRFQMQSDNYRFAKTTVFSIAWWCYNDKIGILPDGPEAEWLLRPDFEVKPPELTVHQDDWAVPYNFLNSKMRSVSVTSAMRFLFINGIIVHSDIVVLIILSHRKTQYRAVTQYRFLHPISIIPPQFIFNWYIWNYVS